VRTIHAQSARATSYFSWLAPKEVFVSHRLSLLIVLILVLICSASTPSQQAAVDARRKEEDLRIAVTQQKALKLLESVAGQVNTLRSAENRARIGSNTAELLWKHDEKRARSLFAATAEDISAGFNTTELDESGRARMIAVFSKLRRDIVSRIATHDPDLALEYLRTTRPTPDEKLLFNVQYLDRALELQLAGKIAANNPQLALKLGRESLARCFCSELLPLLTKMGQKDKGAALDLYKAIVDKLKNANLSEDESALELALTMVRELPSPAFDEQAYHELISVLLTSALANGCGASEESSYLCRNIGSVFSQIEKYDPARAAGLRRWAGEERSYDEQMGTQIREVVENGTVEEILALAPRYPDMQVYIQRAAILKLELSGDAARARQMAVALPDEAERNNMLAELDRSERWTLITNQKLAEIQRELASLSSNEERAEFLLFVADHWGGDFLSEDNRKTKLRLLNQAGQIIDSIKTGKEQFAAQIRLAVLYCSIKSDRGFAIMESVVPKLNELVAAAATLDRFENTYLRDGEWAMSAEGNVGALLTNLAQSAGYFAWSDFDRSVILASQFERPELRLMAQLRIAQGVLAGTGNSDSALRAPFGLR
jgi:hypothetical protein